ncbi:ABC-type multidrug transport system, ATPase and permease component [Catalinimonas alkaloidigena]|uniref:ABC-type multidrug transport system, ATPase and permease component n=1 Tax=Catalinimonas alkaloidigena TaxID=1075417 RepID=A0A1G9T8M5_9BACT|nr:ABC transporter ATP-binding protein [Catalinimonas alkaloidigena]SDM44007.1 ABC-type multidrug transport system, ATPase and permease component [Catalinimonas alkaloidigena]
MRNPYFSLLGTAWRYAREARGRFVLIYAMFGVANLIFSVQPLLYGWFVTALQREGTDILRHVWLYAGGYLALRVLEWCFHGPARVMERALAFRVGQNFLEERYHQVVHLPLEWHQDHHSGATINRLRKAHEALRDFFQAGFVYLHALAKFVFSFAAMLYFAPLYGCIGVGIGLLIIAVIFRFDKPFVRTLREVNEREHLVSSTLFDSLSNIVTVVTLRLEKRMETSLLRKVMDVFPPFRRNIEINEWKWFTAQMLIGLIYAVVTVGYVHEHWQPGQVFLIGGLVTLLGYVNQFTSVFNDVAYQYTQIVQYHTHVQTAEGMREAYERQHRPEPLEGLPDHWQRLDIEHLSFAYRQRHAASELASTEAAPPTGLHGLTLRLVRGQRVALIGESGSGKSTLLALLRGLYEPQPGVQLRVDGLPHPDFSCITQAVTLLPQEPEIFENTLRYNITLGLPFSEEEVWAACETAQFAAVLRQLPHGLDTNIQEKGINLSGGQRQRLALARGLLAARTSSLVLMDEPTSSVDPRTEMQLYHELFRAFANKAVVSSLHRLHLLLQFDYIYLLDRGCIVDEGTFEDLRRRSERFAALWQYQETLPVVV